MNDGLDNLDERSLDEILESPEFNKALDEAIYVPQYSNISMTIEDYGR